MSGPDYPGQQQYPSRQPQGNPPPPGDQTPWYQQPPERNYPGGQPQSPAGYPPQWPQQPGHYPQYPQQPGHQYPQQPAPQYGQQPAPQYAQPAPQYGQQPAPYGMPGPTGTGGAPRQRHIGRWLSIGGTIVVVLIAAALVTIGPWTPSFFKHLFHNNTLDVTKAQTGVQQILTDPVKGYGIKKVSDVKCNNGANPPANKGDTFTCDVKVDGTPRKVSVVIADDNGTYEIDRPK